MDMLDTAQSRGLVSKVTNFVDEYLENQEALATTLPYFEGDYWVGEIENLITEVAKEEKDSWNATARSKEKKKVSHARATRASSMDTEIDRKRDRNEVRIVYEFCAFTRVTVMSEFATFCMRAVVLLAMGRSCDATTS
jgi:hypothetical protein